MLVHQRVRVEQIVATFEEDVGQLRKESLYVAPHDLFLLLIDQKVDSFAGAEGVRPLFHLEGILHLSLAQLEEELLALRVV